MNGALSNSTLGAIGVASSVFLLLGGLKAVLWPWLLRRRYWGRR